MINSDVAHRVIITGGYFWGPLDVAGADAMPVDSIIEATLGNDWVRRLDPLSQYAILVVDKARHAAALSSEIASVSRPKEGVCVGTSLGAQRTRVRYARRLAWQGPSATNPIDFPDSIDGAPAAHIAIRWGLQGPSLTIVSGQNAAVDAVVAAARQVSTGRADRMHLVVGDVFAPFLREAVAGTLSPQSFPLNGGASTELSPVSPPKDAILALILERFPLDSSPDQMIELVGFQRSNLGGGVSKRLDSMRAVTTPSDVGSHPDLSGVLAVAGAWLGVRALMGNNAGSCHDDSVRFCEYRRCQPNSNFPDLGFVRLKR